MKKPGNQVRYQASGSTDVIGGAESGYAVTRDSKQKNEVEIESVKLRAGEEPPPFKAEFTADEQMAAFRFLGTSKAELTETDTQAELALFAIVQFKNTVKR